MNNFIYDIPTKVYFGKDQLGNLGADLKKFGNRVLLTYGGGSIKRMGLYNKVVDEIKKAGLELFELSGIEPNPRIGSVREGVRICKTEKIDVVLFSEKPEEYIAAALSPASVIDVDFDGERSATVWVDSDQLSLAIGKEGQNVRLAVRLTGYKIDIKSRK